MTDYALLKDHYISIHTPTRGVTKITHTTQLLCIISIHTPTRGVTTTSKITLNIILYFNPHSHEGSDDYTDGGDTGLTAISIHTPTRGVTHERSQMSVLG